MFCCFLFCLFLSCLLFFRLFILIDNSNKIVIYHFFSNLFCKGKGGKSCHIEHNCSGRCIVFIRNSFKVCILISNGIIVFIKQCNRFLIDGVEIDIAIQYFDLFHCHTFDSYKICQTCCYFLCSQNVIQCPVIANLSVA